MEFEQIYRAAFNEKWKTRLRLLRSITDLRKRERRIKTIETRLHTFCRLQLAEVRQAFNVRVESAFGSKSKRQLNIIKEEECFGPLFDTDDNAMCSICFNDLKSTIPCQPLPCGHQFHEHCLNELTDAEPTLLRCPTCRQTYNFLLPVA